MVLVFSHTNSIMWFDKHTNRYKIQDLNGYQFYIMSKFSKFGTALLSSLPKHIFHGFHRELKFFNISTEFEWLSIHMLAILWHCILPILSMDYWPFISYVDIVCGFSIPFWTLKGMVDILKNRGWNLMGFAHYAIRLVEILKQLFDNTSSKNK